MSDGVDGEKHFEPTPSRIERAKREGNMTRSSEFGANAAFAAGIAAVVSVGPAFSAAARAALERAAHGAVDGAALVAIAACAIVPMIGALCGGILAGIVQSGGLHIVAISAKVERLNPLESLKRMLSRETFTRGARAVIAFAVSSMAVLPSMRELFRAASGRSHPEQIAALAWQGAAHASFAAAAVGMGFACAEYGVARRLWLHKLRMSFQELKREMKDTDGDPLERQRRKSLHRALLRGAIAEVKNASFVIVNPTHVAVALQYRPPEVPVPVVLLCAADTSAQAARALAIECGIPIVEDVVLARALFRDARVGEAIPNALYVAVAEVVAALHREGVFR